MITTRKTSPQPQRPPPTPDGAPPDAPLQVAMPEALKDAALNEIAGAIDALSQVGEAIKHATVDPTGKPPAVLAEAMGKIAEQVAATQQRLAAAASGGGVTKRGRRPWPADLGELAGKA